MPEAKRSMNNIFLVDPTEEEVLYIHMDALSDAKASNPFIFKHMNEIRQSRRSQKFPGYAKFGNTINFKELDNDCLLLSEGIISEDLSKPKSQIAKLRAQEDRARLFGHSDKQNVQIAKDINKSMTEKEYMELDPDIMQAYAMLPVVLPKDTGGCPYHAATVILKDGNTNVTLEADSGLTGLRKPVFDIYSTTIKDLSFYTRYKKLYSVNGKDPVSTILSSRDKAFNLYKSPTTKFQQIPVLSNVIKKKRLPVFINIVPDTPSPQFRDRNAGRYERQKKTEKKMKKIKQKNDKKRTRRAK